MKNKVSYLVLGVVLLLGFLVRLYKIDNPIADWHSWRQADTAAVTRNYVKHGIDVLHPQYDDFSDVSGNGLFNPRGYRFVEFPIFNLVHYFLYTLIPIHYSLEIWGRLTSILAALTSGVLLFFIVRRRVNAFTGLLAAFFYLFIPFNIYFTRVILPDPLMVTLFLATLNFNDQKRKYLTLLFGSLAVLVKPIAIFFLLPIYVSNLWVGLLMLLPFGLWRLWSHSFPEGIPASLWLLNGNGIRFKGAFFQWIFGERIGAIILGKWGIFPLLSGILVSSHTFILWGVGALLYLFTFAMGNVQHDYYQIPIIPVISVYLAIGVNHLWKNWRSKAVAIISILFMIAFGWYTVRGNYQINHWEIVEAGRAFDRIAPLDARVAAPYMGDTAFLYQTNRQGFPYMVIPIKDMIDRFGVKYYVSVNYDDETNKIMQKYTVREKTPRYVIVELLEPTPIPAAP